MKKIFFAVILLTVVSFAQEVESVKFENSKGLGVASFSDDSNTSTSLKEIFPLFSVEINDELKTSLIGTGGENDSSFTVLLPSGLKGYLKVEKDFHPGWKARLTIENIADTNIKIQNLVPLGQSEEHIYITASAPWNLASSKIFRPGLGSIGIVLPDNAWSLGYSAIELGNGKSLYALARRMGGKETDFRRYSASIKPGGKVYYDFYIDTYEGEWQNGLKKVFQERYLYDLEKFDNALYERKDLEWIRHDYVMTLQMAWDHDYYARYKDEYKFDEYLKEGKRLFGGYDVFDIWPTWPALGLDERNQWDLYADLPGGLEKMRELANYAREHGTKFFIAYNPWDQSTRRQDPYEGMAELIKAVDADGVVLDTQGSSSEKLQQTADSIKSGVIMYSEGMAVPKDMPGIVAGRVHDAIFLPPPLNLNKLIKPDFAIFRVCQLREGRVHREFAISFFNGYGIEMNVFGPGRPDWMEEEYLYLGRVAKILRENTYAFNSLNWTPLLPTLKDSIWVNKFPAENKTIYTVFSLYPEGYNAPLFEADKKEGKHFVDIWHHKEIELDTIDNKTYLPVEVRAFNRNWLGTRREGNVDCIAEFPELLNVKYKVDDLTFSASEGDSIVVWKGMPSYQTVSKTYDITERTISLYKTFGRYESKVVVQLFDDGQLTDERVVDIPIATPRLISKVELTDKVDEAPEGMIEIPAGEYIYKVTEPWSPIPYPVEPDSTPVQMNGFFVDKYPVTNKQYKEFLDASGYYPKDDKNFLKHWKDGNYPEDEADFPVVYVSIEDAKAYAEWAGKRLPTEREWQYAAQAGDTISYPWGSEFDSTKCNNAFGHPTAVDEFPNGANKLGVMDLVGNVWQLTNDVYDNNTYYFLMIRGGSYYNPTSSWWYIKGGPQPLHHRQILLMVAPGFERNSTVGFRCVKDSE